MRNFLSTALEGHRDPTFANLSLEEEQDLIVEAAADEAAVNNDLAQVERISDMSDALEDLAVVTDGMAEDGPTDTEAALVDTMANMAVAGTDVEAEEIVPAMESFGGKRMRYSAESIRERAKAIWESIRKFLKQIWEKITAFFYKIFGTIPALRRRLQDLKKRIQDNSKNTIDQKKITVTTGVASLSVNYKTPTSDTDVRKNLSTMVTACKAVYTDILDEGIKMGNIVLDAINDFDPVEPDASLQKLVPALAILQKKNTSGLGFTGVSGNRFGDGYEAQLSDPLPGNISIVLKRAKKMPTTTTSVSSLEELSKFDTGIVQTSDKPKDTPSSFEMSTAGNANMLGMVDESLEILDILEGFQRGKRATEMKSLRGKLETASEKASNAMKKLSDSEEKEEKAAVPYYRALLNFNTSFTRWMKDPAMPMVSHSLSAIRGAMNVCQKSLSAYK